MVIFKPVGVLDIKKLLLLSTVFSFIISVSVFVIGSHIENKKNAIPVIKEVSEDVSVVAGVIRNSGKGWNLIVDDGHETLGIKSVSQDPEKIVITYDDKSKVYSLTVTVDETMALEGYTVGASVGTDKTYIYIYDKNNSLVNPSDYINKLGNIWIQGLFK